MSPSHRLQFFMNYSSMGPFQEVQSIRNRLLQSGSPTGPQCPPAKLLQHGLVSLRAHRSCRCLLQSRLWGHSLLQASAYSSVESFLGCSRISAPPLTSTGCRWSSPHASGGSLLQHQKHLFPILLHCLSYLYRLFLSGILISLSTCCSAASSFSPLLKYAMAEVLSLSLAQPLPVAGLCWSWLAWTQGKLLAASYRSQS